MSGASLCSVTKSRHHIFDMMQDQAAGGKNRFQSSLLHSSTVFAKECQQVISQYQTMTVKKVEQ
jgi:hypothetical protein